VALADAAAVAGVPAHLVAIEPVESVAVAALFESVAVLDREAADRLRRIAFSPSTRG
jgi:hypothetical protein